MKFIHNREVLGLNLIKIFIITISTLLVELIFSDNLLILLLKKDDKDMREIIFFLKDMREIMKRL